VSVRRQRWLASIAIATSASTFCQAPEAELQKAFAAHRAGDLAAATSGYRSYLKTHPQAYEIRSNLGAVLSGAGQYEAAIGEYKLALRGAPTNVGIAYNLALAYYKSGAIADAARELSTLRALTPDNPQINLLLADCWLRMGENAKVIDLLAKPAETQKEDLAMAYLLGTAQIRAGKVEEGQKLLDRIFQSGESAEVRLLLGTAKLTASDFAGALVDLKKAVELNPELPSANAYYGKALMATGDTEGAAKAFRQELAVNPNDFDANLNLAVLLKQDQDFGTALKHLNQALRVRPKDLRVRYQLATIDVAEGKIDAACNGLESVVAEAPRFVEAHVTLATVYYRLKRRQDGDRERRLVEQLNAEIQAAQPKGTPISAESKP